VSGGCIEPRSVSSVPRWSIGKNSVVTSPTTALPISAAPARRPDRVRRDTIQTPTPSAVTSALYGVNSRTTNGRVGAPAALSSLTACVLKL
jgi:hypothetical protein